MKIKTIFSIISLTLLLFLTSCNINSIPLSDSKADTTKKNVTLSTEKSTYTTDVDEILCKLINNTDEKLTYGEDYKLLKSENGNFTEVSPKNDSVQDMAYILEPNETDEITYNVASKYGKLDAGEYKISMNIENDEVTCQFTVK